MHRHSERNLCPTFAVMSRFDPLVYGPRNRTPQPPPTNDAVSGVRNIVLYEIQKVFPRVPV